MATAGEEEECGKGLAMVAFFRVPHHPWSEQEELVEDRCTTYIFIFQNGGKSKRKIISCLQFFIYSHGGLVSKFKPQG
jgi:hypothetical protein